MWANPQVVTFTEKILNGKLHFLCNVRDVSRTHLNINNEAFLRKYSTVFRT